MPDYSGNKEIPRLAGMHPKYTALQIMALKSGKRAHPPVDGMGSISNEEAEGLAQYFGQLP